MSGTALTLSSTSSAFCMILILLVPLAGAGLALINTGLGRSRSAAQLMMSSLCVMSVAAIVYFVFGFAFQGYSGNPAHTMAMGGKSWSWLGDGHLFLHHVAF